MMFSLKNRISFVTGAATGIGQAIAQRLAEAGSSLVLSDKPGVSLEKTHALCAQYNVRILLEEMDVRDLTQIREVFARLKASGVEIDILVNNAGINRPTKALDVDGDNWDDHFNTNVRGGYFCAQSVAPGMIERSFGRIIFVSSQSGLIGIPGQPVYCATKGALVNLVRSLGVEWAKHGITVNTVAPTFIETNLTRERLKNPDFRAYVLGKIPKGELSVPDDVAHAVVYLASDEAAMVNCHTFSVDGGWTAW